MDGTFATLGLPVQTLTRELPLDQLQWEHSEIQCARLLGADGQFLECRRHGRQGSAQGGIDLLSARREGRTIAAQCQRVVR